MQSAKIIYPALFNRLFACYKEARFRFGYSAKDAFISAKNTVNYTALMETTIELREQGLIS